MEISHITREEFEKLQKSVAHLQKTTNENNYILHRMQYWGRVAFWAKVIVWTIVLIAPIFLYSYFAPYINLLPGGAGMSTSASSTSLFGFPSPTEVINSIHHR